MIFECHVQVTMNARWYNPKLVPQGLNLTDGTGRMIPVNLSVKYT